MKHDVIIIGSGFGGLACALLLAQAGRSVLVLERHWQPGGCLQSFTRRGHAFDTGYHYVGGLAEGQPMHDVFTRLGLMQLPWHRLDVAGFDRVTIGGRTFMFAEGFDSFVETLAEDFPHEREALHRYAELLQGDDPAPDVNAYDWLHRNFHDPMLIDVVSGSCLKTELRRASLPLLSFLHSQRSYIQSSWRLRGDSGLIVRTLVDGIRQAGGDVLCRREVTELTERDRRLATAVCTNGEGYEADWFVSDIHPALTFQLVGECRALRPIFRRRMTTLENTAGLYTHQLVLRPQTLPYFNHNKYMYAQADVWDERTPRVMVSCRVPEDDSGYATLVDLLTPHATDPMPLAETVIPGLSGMVAERYVSTPQTWQRFTATPGGSAYGVRKDCRQPLQTMLSTRTPIANLLLTGQSVMLHGLEGVAMTALDTCSVIKKLRD